MNIAVRHRVLGAIAAVSMLAMAPSVSAGRPEKGKANPLQAAADSPSLQTEITVPTGYSRSMHTRSDIERTTVSDADILSLVQAGPRDVTVVGLKPGTCTVQLWMKDEKESISLIVHVESAATASVSTASHEHKKNPTPDLTIADPNVTQAASPAQSHSAAGPGLPIEANTNYVQQVPALSIETSSPIAANVGRTVEQQILVKNVGSVAAEAVEIRGTLSITCELVGTQPKAEVMDNALVWRLGTLAAGTEQKLTVRVKPVEAGELECRTSLSFKSVAALKVQVREPKLKLTCDGPQAVTVGSEVRFAMTVINTGSGPAEGVKIRQVLPGVVQASAKKAAQALAIDVGTLEPGESRTLETISRADAPGTVKINLVAECETQARATAEHTLQVQAAKLDLTTEGPDFRLLNRKASYQMLVTNSGNAIATGVHLMVGLPEGLQYVNAEGDAVYDPVKRTVAWVVGAMEPGTSQEYTLTVLPKSEGEHLQRAVAWADQNLLVKSDKVTRVEGFSSLTMRIAESEDPIEVGGEVAYQIQIANRGTKAAEHVQVTAVVPAGMELVNVASSLKYETQGQAIVFDAIPAVAAESTTVVQVRLKGTSKGDQRFRALMRSPSLSTAVVTEEGTMVVGE
jgi:uncharacterized repeat protein (TIGR01451 family)